MSESLGELQDNLRRIKPALQIVGSSIDDPELYTSGERLTRDPMPAGRGHHQLGHHFGPGYQNRRVKVSGDSLTIISKRSHQPTFGPLGDEFVFDAVQVWAFHDKRPRGLTADQLDRRLRRLRRATL